MSTPLQTVPFDIARAMAADLRTGPHTCDDLALAYGVDVQAVERWIDALGRPEIGAVHVVGFREMSRRGARLREYRWNPDTAELFERLTAYAASKVIAKAARR